MTRSVLILGASGRFGRACSTAFSEAGWQVQHFVRTHGNLIDAASGVQVIVNGWNPAYPDWATQVPELHMQVIAAARANGATVVVPGNVYVFGEDTPSPWSENTSHRAKNPLGRIRVEMEAAYKRSGVSTIVVRSGDFLDTEASGNWFDLILTKDLAKGRFTYPGKTDVPHAWAYLPDLARAVVGLVEKRDVLPIYADIPFSGYTLTGQQMFDAVNSAVTRSVQLKSMSWWPLQLARPFWPMGRCLLEMRYLWDTAHRLDGALLESLLPDLPQTPLDVALVEALPSGLVERNVHPNQVMTTGRNPGLT
ncbi:sugar nucleotide-binding protein [Parasedimentitalea maritima]|uniref:Epimerase n=1 Tax=Parasedimentitalea maritima TaxID=2578117 RepID=A0A6A4RQ50_9RHOB|nr:sugar nucleotide-binding protein [Zongyanglinia marina]KAE9632374.1 epimerase [Zongyanglinia marina]